MREADFILMIEDDTVVREADQLDLFEEEDEVMRPPDQERLLLPLPPHLFLQDPQHRGSVKATLQF